MFAPGPERWTERSEGSAKSRSNSSRWGANTDSYRYISRCSRRDLSAGLSEAKEARNQEAIAVGEARTPTLIDTYRGARAGIRTRVSGMKTHHDGPDYTTRATSPPRRIGFMRRSVHSSSSRRPSHQRFEGMRRATPRMLTSTQAFQSLRVSMSSAPQNPMATASIPKRKPRPRSPA